MAEMDINKENKTRVFSEQILSRGRVPKNVRQIGMIDNGFILYMEDYVKTYSRQLAENDFSSRCMAVLVGEYRYIDEVKNTFIYGAVKVELQDNEEVFTFNEDIWANIYEKIKEYFSDSEIVGWYYGGTGLGTQDFQTLERIQKENFAGRDKVLMTYDVLEKENNFYTYDGITFQLQKGYYIYYEKNEEMQNYMVDHKKQPRDEEQVNNRVVQEMRAKLNEKRKPEHDIKANNPTLHLGYFAAAFMMFGVIAVGVTLLNNQRKLNEMEETVASFKNIFDKPGQNSNQTSYFPTNPVSPSVFPTITQIPTQQPEPVLTATPIPTEIIAPTPTPTIEPTIAVPEPTKPVVNPVSYVEYEVKAGDTLASICLKQCGSYSKISEIKDMNQILDEDIIYEGQILLLPAK